MGYHNSVKRAEVSRNEHDRRVLHADIEMADGNMIRRVIVFRDEPKTERISSGRIQKASQAAFAGEHALASWVHKRRAKMFVSETAGWLAASRVPAHG